MLPTVVHVGAVAAAVVGLGGSAALLARSDAVRAHRRGALAVIAMTVGLAGLLAAVWSSGLRDALGAFVTTPGLGGLAAAAAGTLALYGVLRELGAAADRSSRQRDVQAAEEYARHFRWACELVLASDRPADIEGRAVRAGRPAPTRDDRC